jgi:tRNA A-37 threonylcarbamoyl transferase component Bud32
MPELGRGGFGVVILDKANGAAIKYSLDPGEGAPVTRQELGIMRQAAQLGVGPKVLGVNREALAMEFLDGYKTMEGTGASQMNGAQQKQLARGIFSQLEKLHRADIAHGDFHPGNVMFDSRGNVKLVDFGLASRGDDMFDAPTGYDMQTARMMFNHIPLFRDRGVQSALRQAEEYTSPDEVFSRIYKAIDRAKV